MLCNTRSVLPCYPQPVCMQRWALAKVVRPDRHNFLSWLAVLRDERYGLVLS